MGLDAGLFAKKAKKYYWFDRLYNIQEYDSFYFNLENHKIQMSEKEFNSLDNTYDKLVNRVGVKKDELIGFLRKNMECWTMGDPERVYHAGWCKCLIKFVEEYPDDEFFVVTDNSFDIIDLTDKYEQIPEDTYLEYEYENE